MEWNVYSPKVVDDAALGNVVVEVGYSLYQKFDAEVVQGAYGFVRLADPDPSGFVQFDALTKETVLAWVKDALGEQTVLDMERELSELIAAREQLSATVQGPTPAAFSW